MTQTKERDAPPTAGLLAGAPNFRDLGGIAAWDGGRTAAGKLFRSGSLHDLTPADLARLDQWSIGTVCDLRSRMERERFPSMLPPGSRALRMDLEINRDARAGDADFIGIVKSDPSAHGAYRGMIHNYQWFPRAFETGLGRFFDRLLDPAGAPMVFHCHAGKDRTGFVAAMLLWALGASREAIIADYLQTVVISDAAKIAELAGVINDLAGVTLNDAAVLPVLEVHEDYLDAAFAELAATYGGADAYLESVAGLTPARREQLRALYLA